MTTARQLERVRYWLGIVRGTRNPNEAALVVALSHLVELVEDLATRIDEREGTK